MRIVRHAGLASPCREVDLLRGIRHVPDPLDGVRAGLELILEPARGVVSIDVEPAVSLRREEDVITVRSDLPIPSAAPVHQLDERGRRVFGNWSDLTGIELYGDHRDPF